MLHKRIIIVSLMGVVGLFLAVSSVQAFIISPASPEVGGEEDYSSSKVETFVGNRQFPAAPIILPTTNISQVRVSFQAYVPPPAPVFWNAAVLPVYAANKINFATYADEREGYMAVYPSRVYKSHRPIVTRFYR